MEKYTATKVTKEDAVLLASNTTLDKALLAISRDANDIDEELADKIAWVELIVDANEAMDIQGEFIIKFNFKTLYRIDID